MPLVINTNVAALNSQRQLVKSGEDMAQAMERLSSGKRINTAADDAAGLAISNRMTSQVRGLNQAIRNANDGISLIQTAEGALDETTNILQRMRELAIQASNGIYADKDRSTLDAEVQQLIKELDRIADTTSFNGQKLLDGTLGNVELQVGAEANQTIGFSIQAMSTQELGLGSTSSDLTGDRLSAAGSFDEGDIIINGVGLSAHDFSTDNLKKLLDDININVEGVTAEGFNVVEADSVGSGILSGDEALQITLASISGQPSTSYMFQNTASLDDLVSAINGTAGGNIEASVNDQGRLVLSNTTGGNITVAVDDDITDGGGSFSVNENGAFTLEAITGMPDSGTAGTETFTGSLSLKADEGTEISVVKGANGTDADLAAIGFREVGDGTVQGSSLSSVAQTTALGASDLTINGVRVALTASAEGLQGKVENINDISDQTGVVATVKAEQSYGFNALITPIEVTASNAFVAGATSYGEIHFVGASNPVGQTLANALTFDVTTTSGTSNISIPAAAYTGTSLVAEINADIAAGAAGTDATAYLDDNGNLAFRQNVSGGTLVVDNFAHNAADAVQANALFGFDVVSAAGAGTAFTESSVGFSLNGTDIDLATAMADGSISAVEIADAVNTASVGVKAYVDELDKLHFSSDVAFTLGDDAKNSGFVATLDTGANLNAGTHSTAVTSGSLKINGFEVSGISLTNLGAAVTTINGQQANTGVVASIDENGQLELSANSSITLDVGNTAGVAVGAVLGINFVDTGTPDGVMDTQTVNAGIELRSINSSSPISVEVTSNGAVATGFVNMNTDLSSLVTGTALSSINVSTLAAAQAAIDPIDNALETINATRSEMGAVTNRLEFTMSNLMNVTENTTAARSRIMDADFAAETANLSRAQVLQQASQAMLAQANAQPQQVLQLLNG